MMYSFDCGTAPIETVKTPAGGLDACAIQGQKHVIYKTILIWHSAQAMHACPARLFHNAIEG